MTDSEHPYSEHTEELEEILARIHSGRKLHKAELNLVATILQDLELQEVGRKLSADDIYLLLSALFREDSWKDERLFERFFDIHDPTTASLVMKKLCSSKEGRKNYLERLFSLALGSDWDSEGDLQQDAIEFLGEFACEERKSEENSPRQKQALLFLFDLFDDENSSREQKQWAYCAILRASGLSHEQLPSRYAIYEFTPSNSVIAWNTLNELRIELL
jgi:hypothetical protein